MKKEDLRIGNLCYYKVEDSLDERKEWNEGNVIDALDLVAISQCEIAKTKSNYEPIPLTAEWLKKFGAKNTIDVYWISISNLKAEFHFEVYEKEIVTTIKSDFCNLILDQIKYVHELQNLYYALTKDELVLAAAPTCQ